MSDKYLEVLQTSCRHFKEGLEEESLKAIIHYITTSDHHDYQNNLVVTIVYYILQDVNKKFDNELLQLRMSHLRDVVRIVLDLPKGVEHQTGSIRIDSKATKRFEALVKYTLKCLTSMETTEYHPDMFDECHYYSKPMSYKQINLGIAFWPSLTKVLGTSQSPSKLYKDPFTCCARLASILHTVNRDWSVLFSNLSTQQLIPNSCFECEEILISEIGLLAWEWDRIIYDDYSFLIPSYYRMGVIYDTMEKNYSEYPQVFEVSRQVTVKDANMVLQQAPSDAPWFFKFKDEMGTNVGPTKEFYTTFSQDCSKYEHNLWIGDPKKSSNGVEYINSENGLFPSPCPEPSVHSRITMETIGKLMAKSLTDGMLMNLDFSKSLCKILINANEILPTDQHLRLSDIKDVVPHLSKFVEGLVDILKMQEFIRLDKNLTEQEQEECISNLTYDGVCLEDLCIDFTLPGYPDIEMVEGGRDKYLNIENITDYLKLLVWWFLYKGPQEKIKCLQQGFLTVHNEVPFSLLQIEDMQALFGGIENRPWIKDELRFCVDLKNCNPSLTEQMLDILSKFSSEEQEQFLMFATSVKKLPFGGLAALDPTLTIYEVKVDDDGSPVHRLPSAMTCTNALLVPDYRSKDVLRKKLLMAIQHGGDSFQMI